MDLFLLVVLAVARSGVSVEDAGHLSGLSPRGFKEVSTHSRSLVLFSGGGLLRQRRVRPQLRRQCILFQARA